MSYEINLIEGERGKVHVTSDDARTKNALMFGKKRMVFNMDNAFEAAMLDSNTVRITSGVFYDNGMFIRIDRERYVEVTIENGLAGTYRNDLICIRYERNIQTQLESASIVVKKGEASETAAADPDYTVGDVLDLEVHLDEFPLYRVALDGITPTLEPLFTVEDIMDNISIYNELVEHMQDLDNPHQITSVEHSKSTNKLKTPVKINGVEFDGTRDVTLPKVEADDALSGTSTNAVQNKVLTEALYAKMSTASIYDATDFNTVKSIGVHHIYNAECINAPTECSYGMLIVSCNAFLQQTFFPGGTQNSKDQRVYTRFYDVRYETWSGWDKLGLNTIQSSAIATKGLYALDAVEKNASVKDTLAYDMTWKSTTSWSVAYTNAKNEVLISITGEFTEASGVTQEMAGTILIPKADITDVSRIYTNGYHYSNLSYCLIQASVSSTAATNVDIYRNEINITKSKVFYYR